MVDLSTEYMGLNLKNPIIVSSCGYTGKVENIKKCEENGAGAVVLKSLFEEQIIRDTEDMMEDLWLGWHTESIDYVRGMGMALGPESYIGLIKESKVQVDIPIIASLNCISTKWWLEYAKRIEGAGADALELNIAIMPVDPDRKSEEIERKYYDIADNVIRNVGIPVSVKIGPYFTNLPEIARELYIRGISALVLFNRFYQLDIDIENIELTSGNPLSASREMSLPLRWIALLSSQIECDFSATTGIHTGKDVVKVLLSGANSAQICSTLYKNGVEFIGKIVRNLENWMLENGYEKIEDFRGMLSREESEKAELYERIQYIKSITE